jgi:hypothetical protein
VSWRSERSVTYLTTPEPGGSSRSTLTERSNPQYSLLSLFLTPIPSFPSPTSRLHVLASLLNFCHSTSLLLVQGGVKAIQRRIFGEAGNHLGVVVELADLASASAGGVVHRGVGTLLQQELDQIHSAQQQQQQQQQ